MRTTNKISPLESLNLKRMHLQTEADTYAQKLDNHINDLQQNFGSMLFNTAASTVVSKLPPAVRQFLPNKYITDENTPLENACPQSIPALLADQAIELLPLFLKGIKPIIATFILKRIKNYFFERKKK